MTMFQIEKLAPIYRISVTEQRQVVGGFHHGPKKPYALWRGYHLESYDIEKDGDNVLFTRGEEKVGAIDTETGESVKVSNTDMIY